MNLQKAVLSKMTIAMAGGIMLLPQLLKAGDTMAQMINSAENTGGYQMMTSANYELIRSAMSHVSVAEKSLLEAQARGNRAEIVTARETVIEAERLVLSLLARSAKVPYSRVANMHSSGMTFNKIGVDLRIFPLQNGAIKGVNQMMGSADFNAKDNMDMSNISNGNSNGGGVISGMH